MLERQTTLAVAMTAPELLIEPELGDIGLRDFHRMEDAVAAGRRAAEAALPGLIRFAGILAGDPDHRQARAESSLRSGVRERRWLRSDS